METQKVVPPVCDFCPHAFHGGAKCPLCRCKDKPRWWQKVFGGLGNAIGESLFGGDR
jgi:hypothetical protein